VNTVRCGETAVFLCCLAAVSLLSQFALKEGRQFKQEGT
jgi:hypothetical protein